MGLGLCKKKLDKQLTLMSGEVSQGDDKSRQVKPMMTTQLKAVKNVSESPKLPVPSLAQTFRKYFIYLKLLNSSEFMMTTNSTIESFINGDGQKLQKKLYERYMKSTNWANEFWFSKFLLSPRLPVPISSTKGYLFQRQMFVNKQDHLRFAAKAIHCLIEVMLFMYEYQLPMISKPVGIMAQMTHNRYLTLDLDELNTTFRGYRLPGTDNDIIVPASRRSENEHIVIAYKNHFFTIDVIINREFQSVESIYHGLADCFRLGDRSEGQQVGILTCDERTNWASIRKLLSRDNLDNLTKIERSIFIVCLDLENYNDSNGDEDKSRCLQMLCGAKRSMGNRWFDKPVQLIVNSDGGWGLCIEKSLVDEEVILPVMQHMIVLLSNELETSPLALSYTSLVLSSRRKIACPCSILKWDLSDFMLLRMVMVYKAMTRHIDSLDYVISEYKYCGGDFFRKNGINIDAFLHLAFHLTYYRMNNCLGNIYSSISLLKFRQGREDNCRSLTSELLQWCKGMCTGSLKKKSKHVLMKKALNRQIEHQQEVLKGNGIDNHMLALERLSEITMTGKPEIFESEDFKKFMKYSVFAKSTEMTIAITTCPGISFQGCYTMEANVLNNKIVLTTVRIKDKKDLEYASLNSFLHQSISEMIELFDPTFPIL